MQIEDHDPDDNELREALALLSQAAAAAMFPQWLPTLDEARKTVRDAGEAGHVTRVAFLDGRPAGWISLQHVYGQVWEIHPLLVDVREQGKGFGAALARDAEHVAVTRGAGVVVLSTADQTGATSLGGSDLYADPLQALAAMTVDPRHPIGFWQRMGYAVVGVTPDAEGPGQPSIHLAKRPV